MQLEADDVVATPRRLRVVAAPRRKWLPHQLVCKIRATGALQLQGKIQLHRSDYVRYNYLRKISTSNCAETTRSNIVSGYTVA